MLVLMVPRVRVHKNSTDIALDVFKRCSVAVKVKADCSISHRKNKYPNSMKRAVVKENL